MKQSIVITMGDPSGVGAEVTVRALAARDAALREQVRVIGDRSTVARAAAVCGVDLPILAPDEAGDGIRVDHIAVDGLPGHGP